jgi:acyl-CoA dehydrogenase
VIDWSETQQAVRDMVQKFVEAEIKPRVEELEHGDTPPYDVMRKLYKTFGMDEMARQRFQHQIARTRRRKRPARAASSPRPPARRRRATTAATPPRCRSSRSSRSASTARGW